MINPEFFSPEKPRENMPFVIALPGLVAEGEPTRINEILEQLKKEGIFGIRVNYTQREQRGDKVFYRFDFDSAPDEIGGLVQHIVGEHHLDVTSAGIISNSISAVPATKYLIANPNGISFRGYAAISPLLGWQYFGSPEIRRYIEENECDLPILNGDRATKKFVPRSMLPSLKKQDVLAEAGKYHRNGMTVMTVVGKKDTKADPRSMIEYHRLLGGAESDLVLLDERHDVPGSNQILINFMRMHLLH